MKEAVDWAVVVFKTASTYLEIWRQKRWAQQEEDSLGCA
jgi:uncharacterized lipoprotein YmbA